MDGVLIDSGKLHTQAWEIYLDRIGRPLPGIGALMHGKRNDQIVRTIFGDALPEDEVAFHGAEKERVYRSLMEPVLEDHLLKGLREFLERTADRPRAVASNAEPANLDFVLDRAGLRHHFQAVVDGHQVEHPKPHPAVFERAAALLGERAEECIVFEDSPGGVSAARAARSRVIGLETTLRPVPGVDLSIPDFLDPRLDEWILRQGSS